MKQMPVNYHTPIPFQPMRPMQPRWSPYQTLGQQAIQHTQQMGSTSTKGSSSGLLGLLKKFNPSGGGLFETIDKIQHFLKMSQSIAPKIQEYAPLIKNLPTMLELMKEFEDDDEGETNEVANSDLAENTDGDTDLLDQILGIEEVEEVKEEPKTTKKQEAVAIKIEDKNTKGDNLFKIETMSEENNVNYHAPMLFV